MEIITSVQNPRVRAIRALLQKKERQEQGLFLAEGVHCVGEALSSGAQVMTLVVEEGRREAYAELLPRHIPQLVVTASVMEALSETRTPQGIVAVAPLVTRPFTGPGGAGLLLVMDDVRDPGNVGTMLRTADAAGFDAVLVSAQTVDVHNPKVVRASMGSIFHLPIWESGDMARDARSLAGEGWALLSGQLDGQDFFTRKIPKGPQALVIGNEAAGVTPPVRAACGYPVRLAMADRAESLNAAVAAAIMMDDMARTMGRFA